MLQLLYKDEAEHLVCYQSCDVSGTHLEADCLPGKSSGVQLLAHAADRSEAGAGKNEEQQEADCGCGRQDLAEDGNVNSFNTKQDTEGCKSVVLC